MLFADIANEFTYPPENLRVHRGDVAMLACEIEGAPSVDVRWYKDNHLLDTVHVNYHVHADGVLEVRNVQQRDFGKYKCQATNTGDSQTSQDAYVNEERIKVGSMTGGGGGLEIRGKGGGMRRIKVGSMGRGGGVGNKGERGWDETDQGREYDGRGWK